MSTKNVGNNGWIEFGINRIPALVLHEYTESWVSAGYYQNGLKVIKDDFVLKEGVWEFKTNPPSGTYIKDSFLQAKIKSGPYSTSPR